MEQTQTDAPRQSEAPYNHEEFIGVYKPTERTIGALAALKAAREFLNEVDASIAAACDPPEAGPRRNGPDTDPADSAPTAA